MTDSLSKALEGYRPGFALPGVVYKDPAVYELEVRHIVLKAWHYVGHHSMVPGRGDYFLFEIAGESVIVVRDGEGGINAFMNVCRHRGSRICDAACSSAVPHSGGVTSPSSRHQWWPQWSRWSRGRESTSVPSPKASAGSRPAARSEAASVVGAGEVSTGPVAAAGAVDVRSEAQPTSTVPATRPAPRTAMERRRRSASRCIRRR